jgi:hypothetical protein
VEGQETQVLGQEDDYDTTANENGKRGRSRSRSRSPSRSPSPSNSVASGDDPLTENDTTDDEEQGNKEPSPRSQRRRTSTVFPTSILI